MIDPHGSLDARIRYAISHRRLVDVGYGGAPRLVEPHDYGIQAGRPRLLAFQRRGPARPGQSPLGWRLFDLAKIGAVTVLDETFAGSRGEAYRYHHHWDAVHARVE